MSTEKKNLEQEKTPQDKKPNDQAGFYFSSSIKIFDPNSGKVLIQKRCD